MSEWKLLFGAFVGCAFLFAIGLGSVIVISGAAGQRAYDPFTGAETEAPSPWLTSLVGKPTHLPQKAIGGLDLPTGKRKIVTLGCVTCVNPSAVMQELLSAPDHQVILVVANEPDKIPSVYFTQPGRVFVVSDVTAKFVPKEMIDSAPQVAEIDQKGTIVAVPKGEVTLGQFVRGDGG